MGGRVGRPGRTTRNPWADCMAVSGLKFVNVRILYGSPKVLKIRETSAGMKTRRECKASSAVEGLSESKSFILLQAERGAMAGKYNCASSILPYVFIVLFMGAKVQINSEITKQIVK